MGSPEEQGAPSEQASGERLRVLGCSDELAAGPFNLRRQPSEVRTSILPTLQAPAGPGPTAGFKPHPAEPAKHSLPGSSGNREDGEGGIQSGGRWDSGELSRTGAPAGEEGRGEGLQDGEAGRCQR